jgi:uridine kinase
MIDRIRLLQEISRHILALPAVGIVRVAVDGVDGAGKTMFADELAAAIDTERPVIRASVDSFHNPRALRYRLGKESPVGFFQDSYDYARLKEYLLDPLSAGGSGIYRPRAFDHTIDAEIMVLEERALPGSILIFDGIFLHRPELRDYWDYSIFLDVPFAVSIPRGASRGFGSPDPDAPTNRRYVEGQKIYLRECDPRSRASVVIDNTDLRRPRIVG